MKSHIIINPRLYRTYSLRPVGLVSVLLVVCSLIGTCEAQSSNIRFTVGMVIFVLAGSVICCLFWGIFTCLMYAAQKEKLNATHSRTPMTATQQTFDLHRQTHITQPQSLPAIGGQPYPVQSYITPTLNLPSMGGNCNYYSEPQNISVTTHISKPVSQPEATLHQDDAPPAYEEAIGMTAANCKPPT